MEMLFVRIQRLVGDGAYVLGDHAVDRLDERGILEWQVVEGLATGRLLLERPNDSPNPIVEVKQTLPDGTDIKAVWSLLVRTDVAKLVTVHFFDRG